MSNFFILQFLDVNKNANHIKGTTYDSASEEVEDIFDDGISIINEVKAPFSFVIDERNYTFEPPAKDRIQFSSNPGNCLVISPKAKDLLSSLELPLEYISINIKGKKLSLDNYYIVNVIGKVKCTDFEKSKLNYNERLKYIRRIDSLVLDESKIPVGTDIFLLGEKLAMFPIVSSKLKNSIEEAGLTGFIFVRPEEYHSY